MLADYLKRKFLGGNDEEFKFRQIKFELLVGYLARVIRMKYLT